MSGINPVGQNYNFQQLASTPPPSKSGWSKFGQVLSGVGSALPMVGGALSGMGINPSFNKQYELIMLQQQIQQQTQIFNTMSNISKSKHEAAMTAIRNMK
jgi:hypothetical protein